MVIRRPSGWTGQNAPRALLAVLFVVALAAAGCSSEDGLDAGDAATVADGSVAEVAVDGDDWTAVEGGEAVPDGAQIRAGDTEVRLTFREGAVRLSPGSEATLTADRVTVRRGEVLVNSDGGLGTAVEDTTVAGVALYRVSSGLAARVGVYRGEVSVRRPAQQRTVAALRELDIADFRLATTATPLHYGDADSWDQELLADAIAFDGEAARLQRGMDLELGTRPLTPTFYRQFTTAAAVPVLAAVAPQTVGRRFGPPADVLLTVFVAEAAAGVEDAVETVTGLRRDGARWGLIAVELDVAADRVVAAIDRLGNRSLALADLSAADRSGDLDIAAGESSGTDGSGGGDDGFGEASDGPTDSATGSAGGNDDTSSGPSGNDGGGGEDPPPSTPPGGGGGGGDPDPPPPPPPPPPSEGPVEQVVDEVVSGIGEPPDGDDVESGINTPEELDPVVKPVRDLLDGD